ncbi:hypothetical protein ACEWY4_008171 [Coilia grayii]|uniref:Olfactory receptor n=1 Tax=Coilia grayii TaxID=363190 RepID=A0ABD1KA45_9TELE
MNTSILSMTLIYVTYGEMGSAKNVFLILVLTIYLASVIASGTVMLLIYMDTSLHKPMYIFLFSLIVNGIIGSTAVWPKVMNILLTDNNTVSYVECLMQVFLIASYGACNYTMLTVMAYDRFVFIFKPLHYHTVMNPYRVKHLVLIGTLIPVMVIFAQICLTSRISLCRHTIQRAFCDNVSVLDLSCDNDNFSVVCNVLAICAIFSFSVLPMFLVILSYLKIILIILKMSADARMKTFATCSPHLIIFIVFSFASLFSTIYNRINPDVSVREKVIRPFFLATNYILIPPFIQPVVYGFKSKEIRRSFHKYRKRAILGF